MRQNAWKACVSSGLLSASLLLGVNSVVAEPTAIVTLPQDITFKGSPGAVQIAVLYGDPAKPGLYVVRLKLPAGAKVMPHTHPEEVRTLTEEQQGDCAMRRNVWNCHSTLPRQAKADANPPSLCRAAP
jgi:hypothetical protein